MPARPALPAYINDKGEKSGINQRHVECDFGTCVVLEVLGSVEECINIW